MRAEVGDTQDERIEHDALGAVRVPATARFGARTRRAHAALTIGGPALRDAPQLCAALGQVKAAAARANQAAGVLEPRLADAIADVALALGDEGLRADLIVDLLAGGGSIALHQNVSEVIANAANERLGGRLGRYEPIDPARHVNASQSTADVCHSAGRIAVLREAAPLLEALERARSTLDAKAHALAGVITLARTCLRDALPASLGLVFAGHATLLARRRDALAASLAPLLEIVLGGTVIGTGAGAPAAYRARVVPLLAEISGLPLRPHPRPSDALSTSDDLSAVSAQLALVAQASLKLARDVRLLASGPSGGFGELLLPQVMEGSSFFPNKANPALPETLLQAALQALGCDRTVQAAGEHADPWLQVFDGLAALNVLEACALLARALDRFEAGCLRGLTADTERCRSLAALGHLA